MSTFYFIIYRTCPFRVIENNVFLLGGGGYDVYTVEFRFVLQKHLKNLQYIKLKIIIKGQCHCTSFV